MVPQRQLFDEVDVKAITWFEYVLDTGRQPTPPTDFRITAFDAATREVVEGYEGAPLCTRMPKQIERLLDNDVNLGPAWVSCGRVNVIMVGEPTECEPYEAIFQVTPAEGHSLEVIYEKFAPEEVLAELNPQNIG